ncbi:MAG: PAS domain S-box protein [Burkholderiaceae bacterium]
MAIDLGANRTLVVSTDVDPVLASWQTDDPKGVLPVVFVGKDGRALFAGRPRQDAREPSLYEMQRDLLIAAGVGSGSAGLIRVDATKDAPSARIAWSTATPDFGVIAIAGVTDSHILKTWLRHEAAEFIATLAALLVLLGYTQLIRQRLARVRATHSDTISALSTSEERLRLALAASGDGFWDWDLKVDKVFYSAGFVRLLRYRGDDFSRDFSFAKALHPDDRDSITSTIARAIATGQTFDAEYRLRRFDGSWGWFRGRGLPHFDPAGHPVRFSGTLSDITERMESAARLRRSEALFRQVFEQSQAVQLVVDPTNGRIIDANNAACAFYGYSRAQLLTMSIGNINTSAGAEIRDQMDRAVEGSARVFNFTHRLANGEERSVDVYSSPVRTELGDRLHSIIHDTTRRRTAEQALRRAFDRLQLHRTTIDQAMMVAICDADFRLLHANELWCRALGFGESELVGSSHHCLGHLVGTPAENEIKTQLRDGRVWRGEITLATREGGSVHVESSIVPELDSVGTVTRFTSVATNITARKEAFERLRNIEARYEDLFAANPIAMAVFDVDTLELLAVNDSWVSMYGYDRTEALRMRVHDLFPALEHQGLDTEIARIRERPSEPRGGIMRLKHRSGASLELDIDTHELIYEGRRARLATSMPVSDERRAEVESLFRAQLGEAIRQMQQSFILASDSLMAGREILSRVLSFTESRAAMLVDVARTSTTNAPRFNVSHLVATTGGDRAPSAIEIDQDTQAELDQIVYRCLRRNEAIIEPWHAALGGICQEADGADWLVVPLRFGERIVGVLGLMASRGSFAAGALERLRPLFETFGQFRMAIELDEARRLADQAVREATHRLELATSAAGIGIFDWTPATGAFEANDEMFRLYGIQREQVEGRPGQVEAYLLGRLEGDKAREAMRETFQRFLKGESERVDHSYRIRLPDGQEREIHAVWARISDARSGVLRAVGAAIDVSERRRLEEARRERDASVAASQAKSALLSRMSHELRTPLNAILGFTQLLELDPKGRLDPRQLEQVRNIHTAGAHLLAMINNVLDLAVVEEGGTAPSIELVHPEELIRHIADMVRPLATPRGIRIEDAATLEPQAVIRSDPTRLRQILLNLMSNAVKYNRTDGIVRVGRAVVDDRLEIWISDTGEGMDAAGLAKLFTPFTRLSARSHEIEGTGIGLVVTRSLVESLGGSIAVESTPGSGSVFTVQLPTHARTDDAKVPASPQALEAPGR